MNDPDGDPDVVYYREQMTGLEEHIDALQTELGSVRGELDDRTSQLVRLRSQLDTLHWAERLAQKNAIRAIPPELEWAMRSTGPARWHSAWIPLDGRQILITVGGPALAAETEVWHYLQASQRNPLRGSPIGPFIRADLPRPLAAYVAEHDDCRPSVVLGTWLNGEVTDAVRAIRLSWRAHRPGQRLLGVAFLPLLVALRSLRHLVQSQAAIPAATSITVSAMPLISAAVISSPIITSREVGERDFQRGPAPERLAPVDSRSALPPLVRRTTKKPPRKDPATETVQPEQPSTTLPPIAAPPLATEEPPPADPVAVVDQPPPADPAPPGEPPPVHPAKPPPVHLADSPTPRSNQFPPTEQPPPAQQQPTPAEPPPPAEQSPPMQPPPLAEQPAYAEPAPQLTQQTALAEQAGLGEGFTEAPTEVQPTEQTTPAVEVPHTAAVVT